MRLEDTASSCPTRPRPISFANVIASACTRFPVMKRAGKATRIQQLIEARAWNDAALALVELELPSTGRFVAYSTRMANGTARFPGSPIYLWRSMILQPQVTKRCLWRCWLRSLKLAAR